MKFQVSGFTDSTYCYKANCIKIVIHNTTRSFFIYAMKSCKRIHRLSLANPFCDKIDNFSICTLHVDKEKS